MEYCNLYKQLLEQYPIEKEASDNERNFDLNQNPSTFEMITESRHQDDNAICTHRAQVVSYLIDKLCRKIEELENK